LNLQNYPSTFIKTTTNIPGVKKEKQKIPKKKQKTKDKNNQNQSHLKRIYCVKKKTNDKE
jgi:hypothetical protein